MPTLKERILLAAARCAMGYGRTPGNSNLRRSDRVAARLPVIRPEARDREVTIPSDSLTSGLDERIRLAKARYELRNCNHYWVFRYSGHDVSNEPREPNGRWTKGVGRFGPSKQSNRPAKRPPGLKRPADRSSQQSTPGKTTNSPAPTVSGILRRDKELTPNDGRPIQPNGQKKPAQTLEQNQAIWARQVEIGKLQAAVLNFQRDLKNPQLSTIHRKLIERALEETQKSLRVLVIKNTGRAPMGNLANGDSPVATMPLLNKLLVVIDQAIRSGQLSADMLDKLDELRQPENLAKAAVIIGTYAALHASPLAPGLAVFDAYMLGSGAAETGNAMFQLYLDLASATTPQELDAASHNLSQLLAGPAADALLKVLIVRAGKVGGKVVRKVGKAAGEFRKKYKLEFKVDPSKLGSNGGNLSFRIKRRNVAPSTVCVRPKNWKLPKNGTWEGTPGHSNFKPANPAELGLKTRDLVPFRDGYPNLSNWQKGKPLHIAGLNGIHGNDMSLIHKELARRNAWLKADGTPNAAAAERWLTQQRLTPHHAGGNSVQLIPRDLHEGVRHMGGAWELRNQ